MAYYDRLLAAGLLPDALIRAYVRRLCRQRLRDEAMAGDWEAPLTAFLDDLAAQPIALQPATANRQHYEVATGFFRAVLGARMKYSCCWWEDSAGAEADALDSAEVAMLDRSCRRAGLADGQRILELGCGWGSLALFMAAGYPNATITAVSNSSTQKTHIDAIARKRGLTNLEVVTADMNNFQTGGRYDRVVSVEMFEHMRNWPRLLERIAGWLAPGGKLFVHIFTYEGQPYLYDADDPADWMARNFFAGGMMPCPDLLPMAAAPFFEPEQAWQVNGHHYRQTLEAWLQRMDAQRSDLFPLFEREYGDEASKYWHHWRVFFMGCAEVFGYGEGRYWGIHHCLLKKKGRD